MDFKVKRNNPNLHSMIKATGPILQTMQFATVYNHIPSVFKDMFDTDTTTLLGQASIFPSWHVL
jgi:hypothetical protein